MDSEPDLDAVTNGAQNVALVTDAIMDKMDNTNAERQRRYIARLKAAARGKASPVSNAKLEARIRELEAELAERKGHTAAKAPVSNGQARTEPQTDPREVRRLRAEVGRLRELLAKAEAKAATVPPAERDRVIEGLRTRNRNLMAENSYVRQHYEQKEKQLKTRFRISEEAYNAALKCAHPDRTPDKAEKTRTTALLIEWKNAMKKEARRK